MEKKLNKAEQYMYDEFTKTLEILVEHNKKVLYESLIDAILFGESIIKVESNGDLRRIDPMSEEAYKIRRYENS